MTQEQEPWGGDGLGPQDMAIPEIKLVQNVGGDTAKQAGANPGDFYCSLTDEVISGEKGFDMIIVAMRKNRTFWGRGDIIDEPPICASLDANSMKSINGDDCSKCSHRNEAPWLLSPTERREKCLINYNVLGINPESNLPILLRTSGISAQSAKELYTQLSLNRQLMGHWYKAKTRVISVKKKSSAGDAFAIKFGKLELLPEGPALEEFKIQSHQLIGTQIALPEGREPEAASEGKPQPAASAPPAETPSEAKEPEPPLEENPGIDMDF
jgi:hypothetical protein